MRLMSRCRRRPKSLNIVDPPERHIFLYKILLLSMGEPCMQSSTSWESGVLCSWLKISGLKKISGPRNRSYPTSTVYSLPDRSVPLYCLNFEGSWSYLGTDRSGKEY